MIQRIACPFSPLAFPGIEALLGHLQVVVCQVVTEETLGLGFGCSIIILAEKFCYTMNEAVGACEYPAVSGQESWLPGLVVFQEALSEPGNVPQVCDQLRPCLDFLLADRRILTVACAGRPVADGVCRVFFDPRHWRHRAATAALADFFPPGTCQAPAGDGYLLPWQAAKMVVGFDDGVERPGADDLVRLRAQRKREDLFVELIICQPAPSNLRREGGSCPGIHYISFRRKGCVPTCTRLCRLLFSRVYWKLLFVSQQDFTAGIAIPQRESYAKVALPRNAPVPV